MSELIVRTFPDEPDWQVWRVAGEDGRTVEVMCVPYGVRQRVVDVTPRGVVEYDEEFAPGSNQRAVRAPNRTTLTYTHDESLPQRLGYGVEFREVERTSAAPAGLWARFRLDESTAAKARDVLTTTHRAVSVGFAGIDPLGGSERAGDHVVRRAVVLRHVAAVPEGQYADAQVLAVREAHQAEGLEALDHLVAERAKAEQDELLAWVDEQVEAQRALRERFGLDAEQLRGAS